MKLKTGSVRNRALFNIYCIFLLPVVLLSQQQTPDIISAGFSKKEIEKLEKGKIVMGIEEIGADDILVKAYLLFNKQPQTCWNVLSNSTLEKEYLKVIVESHIYPISAIENRVEYIIQWLFFRKKFRLIHYFNPQTYTMQWHLDPLYANDLEEHSGYWQLYPYPGNRTLAAYAGNMAIKGLPHWFENIIKSEVIRLTMIDIKQYIDKNTELTVP